MSDVFAVTCGHIPFAGSAVLRTILGASRPARSSSGHSLSQMPKLIPGQRHDALRIGLIVLIKIGIVVVLAIVGGGLGKPARAGTISYEMVTIGDPGNAADTTGYGAVNYEYRIGKHEVTIGQYAAFLNAVLKTDTYVPSLYAGGMANVQAISGISRSGSQGSLAYSVIGPFGATPAGADSPSNRPITHVNWMDAARFANWMSNGQPNGPQGPTTTENGAYDLVNVAPFTAPALNTINPNTGAAPRYRIPTENEWYKAAYYRGGGTNTGYWKHATQSDLDPGNAIGSTTNQANYYAGHVTGSFSVTQTSAEFFSSQQNYLTNVGAFTGSAGAYGTFDQTGNVWEWNDLDGAASGNRGLRGGSWNDGWANMSSAARSSNFFFIEDSFIGFRLAGLAPSAVPEIDPAGISGILALVGFSLGMLERRRRRSA